LGERVVTWAASKALSARAGVLGKTCTLFFAWSIHWLTNAHAGSWRLINSAKGRVAGTCACPGGKQGNEPVTVTLIVPVAFQLRACLAKEGLNSDGQNVAIRFRCKAKKPLPWKQLFAQARKRQLFVALVLTGAFFLGAAQLALVVVVAHVVGFAFVVVRHAVDNYYGYGSEAGNAQNHLGRRETLSGLAQEHAAVLEQVVHVLVLALEQNVVSAFEGARQVFGHDFFELLFDLSFHKEGTERRR
jgi:hypothetical protein